MIRRKTVSGKVWVDNSLKTCILDTEKQNKPRKPPESLWRPGVGGLSGEHIELCAEGARRKPNLSGKWTETQNFYVRSSPVWAAFLLLSQKEGT